MDVVVLFKENDKICFEGSGLNMFKKIDNVLKQEVC